METPELLKRAEVMAFDIEISPGAETHLDALTARQRKTVFDGIVRQLAHQPNVETRNRKPMRPNPLASWELRIGNLRVYYDFEEEPQLVVKVIAVGKKLRNRVVIGDEEVEL